MRIDGPDAKYIVVVGYGDEHEQRRTAFFGFETEGEARKYIAEHLAIADNVLKFSLYERKEVWMT